MTDNEILSRELLNYLSRVPKQIQQSGPDYLGYFALDLGKCLLWVSGHLQCGTPQRYQPISETPETIWSMGEQFRELGLEIVQGWKNRHVSRLESQALEITRLHERILVLESVRSRSDKDFPPF